MAFSKKGLRKIHIDNIAYCYKIGKLKAKSDWREETNELDQTFMHYAAYYGLGQVKDATITIILYPEAYPTSRLFITVHTLLVDGFLGPEQIIQISPSLIAVFIKNAHKKGWKSDKKSDFRIDFAQKLSTNAKPTLLLLPNMDLDKGTYSNLERPIEIKF